MSEQYKVIMRKVLKRAREIAVGRNSNKAVQMVDVNAAFAELPQDEKRFALAYEDKLNMELLRKGSSKPTAHIGNNAMLLLTQGILYSAIDENDEDFFQYGYGAYVTDAYDTFVTAHKHREYGITAELLLAKMRNGELKMNDEEEDDV